MHYLARQKDSLIRWSDYPNNQDKYSQTSKRNVREMQQFTMREDKEWEDKNIVCSTKEVYHYDIVDIEWSWYIKERSRKWVNYLEYEKHFDSEPSFWSSPIL